jgi:NitT/TauT family transport system permease protein
VIVRVRRLALSLLAIVLLCALWEGYKAIDGTVFGYELPADPSDRTMPHVWDVVERLGDPETRASDRSVGEAVLDAAWYTLRVAGTGFVLGVLVGLALAVLMQRWRVAERGLLPYLVLSQTVPLVALAPLVVAWGGRLTIFGVDWQPWMSVALVSAYLAFCPVAVGALRGLQSPSAQSLELMQSFAASNRATLFKLRFPASVPYLVPALRLAAAAAVVGAIVAEISTGTKGGIGRLILEYSRQATGDPAKVYTAMLGAAALGVIVAGLIGALDSWLMRHRPTETPL